MFRELFENIAYYLNCLRKTGLGKTHYGIIKAPFPGQFNKSISYNFFSFFSYTITEFVNVKIIEKKS